MQMAELGAKVDDQKEEIKLLRVQVCMYVCMNVCVLILGLQLIVHHIALFLWWVRPVREAHGAERCSDETAAGDGERGHRCRAGHCHCQVRLGRRSHQGT